MPHTLSPSAQIPTEPTRILVVEDEGSLADTIRYNLEREGYTVGVASDGRAALQRFSAEVPALVILDLMLPELSGLDVCRLIRVESDVPIIMVTAKDSEADKVAGLELGADDYVTKPFSMRELVSRVRANLRRVRPPLPAAVEGETDEVLTAGPVRMDVTRHEVSVRGEMVELPEGVRAPRGPPPPQRPSAHPGSPDRGGLGCRLLRGHPYPRRAREAPAAQDRRGSPPARAPVDGPRARLQVRGLKGYRVSVSRLLGPGCRARGTGLPVQDFFGFFGFARSFVRAVTADLHLHSEREGR